MWVDSTFSPLAPLLSPCPEANCLVDRERQKNATKIQQTHRENIYLQRRLSTSGNCPSSCSTLCRPTFFVQRISKKIQTDRHRTSNIANEKLSVVASFDELLREVMEVVYLISRVVDDHAAPVQFSSGVEWCWVAVRKCL